MMYALTGGHGRNPGLDGLRGIAALSVALGHCWLEATGLPLWGTSLRDFPHMPAGAIAERVIAALFPSDAAVTVFFVLSGHVLWQSFARKRMLFWRDLPDYLSARCYRLLPLTIISAIPLGWLANAPTRQLVDNMLLFSHSLNGPLWSLQVEIVASALLFALWGATRGVLWKMALGLLFAALLLPRWHAEPLVMFLPAFILGAGVGAMPPWLWRRRTLLAGAVLALVFANVFLGHGGPDRCVEMLAASVLVGAVGDQRLPSLHSRIPLFLGAISYPFYLTHPLGLAIVRPLVLGLHLGAAWQVAALLAVTSVPLALAIAWALHRLVELPAQQARPRMHWPSLITGQARQLVVRS